MMRLFKPIPRSALPDAMAVRVPLPDGALGEPAVIAGVRFDRRQSVSDDAHRSADAGAGVVYVDAVNSSGAFEVAVGSRVVLRGHSYYVVECHPCEDLFGRVHHWELKVR